MLRGAVRKLRVAAILAGLAGILIVPGRAAAAVDLQPVGTFSAPVFITSPPGDPRLFVVERAGRIQLVKNGVIQSTPFLDIHTLVDTNGERGLLSMAFDPNYASNGLFYVFFNDNGSAGATAGDIHIDEFHVTTNPDVIDPATRRPVLTIPHSSSAVHNGGQIQFGPDGYLYISVGEAGTGSNAQSTGNLLGKISRIDPHGVGAGVFTSPSDNPFFGGTATDDPIWSLGLRNPFRFSFDHATGDILIGDVGSATWEEVDDVPLSLGLGRGANYGWPTCEGFNLQGSTTSPCNMPGATAPIFAYPHPNPGGGAAYGCAIIGGYVYRGNQVPELAGRYVYADLCTSVVRSNVPGLPLASDDRSDAPIGAMPNSFGEDSSCNLYVAAGSTVSRIASTSPPSTAPACVAPVPGAGASPGSAGPAPSFPTQQRTCKKHRKHKKHPCKKKRKKKHRA